MHCYQKAKNDLNQRKNLGMGWVRGGRWHTAPRTVWCTINTAASMGPSVGVFCTVPEAPSEADPSPPGVVVTCSLAHALLALLPPWLTSPIPHDASWEDPLEPAPSSLSQGLLSTMRKSIYAEADFAPGWHLAKSGHISGSHNWGEGCYWHGMGRNQGCY